MTEFDVFENIALMVILMMLGAGITFAILVGFIHVMEIFGE